MTVTQQSQTSWKNHCQAISLGEGSGQCGVPWSLMENDTGSLCWLLARWSIRHSSMKHWKRRSTWNNLKVTGEHLVCKLSLYGLKQSPRRPKILMRSEGRREENELFNSLLSTIMCIPSLRRSSTSTVICRALAKWFTKDEIHYCIIERDVVFSDALEANSCGVVKKYELSEANQLITPAYDCEEGW